MLKYGKGFYIISLKDALDHMKTASEIFEKLGTEFRRHLDCLCEIAYLNCLINGCTSQNIYNLECAATTLYRAHFNEIYSKAKLKLAAIYLSLDIPNLIKAKEAIVEAEFVLPYHPCKRLQMLFANIKSVYYKLDSKHSYARREVEKHSMLANGLGKDYVLISKHNLEVQIPCRTEIFNGMTLSHNSLLIDPRIW